MDECWPTTDTHQLIFMYTWKNREALRSLMGLWYSACCQDIKNMYLKKYRNIVFS